VSGFVKRDLDRARMIMRALPEEVRKGIDDALDKGADEVASRARTLAPVGDPADGNLRDAIEVRRDLAGFSPRGALKKLFSGQGSGGGFARFIGVFPRKRGDAGWYAAWVEFGTSERFTKAGAFRGVGPAQPFLGPAFFGARKKVQARVSRAISKAAKAVVGRER